MALIEIPLNSFTYRFRRLTWAEEMRLKFPPREDQRKVVLASALHDVSGLAVTATQAMQILKSLPEALFWRIWIIYRADLPAERYYQSSGLYNAPDPQTYHRNLDQTTQENDAMASSAMAEMEQQAGKPGSEAFELSQQMFSNAQREGRLTPVRPA